MIERYTLPEMGRVWSDAHKYELWCRVEVLVLEAQARAGTVPAESVEPVRSAPSPTPEAVAAVEAVTDHDVIAFLTAWADNTEPRSAAAWVHFGMTSSDLLDTALAVQLAEASGRGHPGRDAGRDRRVGERAGDRGHRVRGGRAGGQALPADRGAGAGRAVPFGAEGLLGHAAQEESDPFGADLRAGAGGARLCDAGHRGDPAVARAGYLTFVGGAGRAAGRRHRRRLPAAPDHRAGVGADRGRGADAVQPGPDRRADVLLRGPA